MAILQEETVHIARQIMAIHPIGSSCLQYIRLVLETKIENLRAAAKSMIPGISRNDVLTSLFPVPPLNEQHRIVKKSRRCNILYREQQKHTMMFFLCASVLPIYNFINYFFLLGRRFSKIYSCSFNAFVSHKISEKSYIVASF